MISFVIILQLMCFFWPCYNEKCYIKSVEVDEKFVKIKFKDSLLHECKTGNFKLFKNNDLKYFKYEGLSVYINNYEELSEEVLFSNSKSLASYFNFKIKAPNSPPVKTPFALLYFIVDEEGNILQRGGELDIETKMKSGNYEREMIEILNAINVKIHPGLVNGNPVPSLCIIPVTLDDLKFIE